MALEKRERICYSTAEQQKLRDYIIDFLRQRYGSNPLVRNLWMTGSLAKYNFGVYKEPFVDRYGVLQEGSDVDLMMVLNYRKSKQALANDVRLHEDLLIRRKILPDGRFDGSYAFLDASGRDLFLRGKHPETGRAVKHPVYGAVFTAKYFSALTAGKYDRETIAKGQGSWKGIEKKKHVIKVK